MSYADPGLRMREHLGKRPLVSNSSFRCRISFLFYLSCSSCRMHLRSLRFSLLIPRLVQCIPDLPNPAASDAEGPRGEPGSQIGTWFLIKGGTDNTFDPEDAKIPFTKGPLFHTNQTSLIQHSELRFCKLFTTSGIVHFLSLNVDS